MARQRLTFARGVACLLGCLVLMGCATSVAPRGDRVPVAAIGSEPAAAEADTPITPAHVVPAASPDGELRTLYAWNAQVETEQPCWCDDRFHFTTIRAWFFQSFVPDRSDPTTLGLEFNSEWGLGNFHFTNISYFELADYPVAVPGMPIGNPRPGVGAATGINDLLSAVLVSRKSKHHGPHHFAFGAAFQLPTATDSTLGSGKWSVGPAAEYSYERGRFFAAFVALNVFSVAGDAHRKDVNMFMLKPMITYDLGSCWKAVYMPYGVSIYWNKKPEDAVYLPLGGGIQRDFRLGRQQMAASLQLFQNVLHPRKGAAQDLRFMLEIDF